MESEEKSMVTLEATVEHKDEACFLKINIQDGAVTIPLSHDDPNAVKSAFNRLIQRIRLGEFTIQLDEVGDDLFSMVANEYLTQLNREIQEVHSQMKGYGLLKSADPTAV